MRNTLIAGLLWLLCGWSGPTLSEDAEEPTRDTPAPAGPPLILRDAATPETTPSTPPPTPDTPPLILRDAANTEQPPREVEDAIRRLRTEMQAVAASSMTAAEKQAAARRIVSEHPQIFRAQSTEMPAQAPSTVEGVIEALERQLFEVAADAAPTEESRQIVERRIHAEHELEPLRPILIARKTYRSKIVVTSEAEEQGYTPWWKNNAATAIKPVADTPVIEEEAEDAPAEEAVAVEFLADEQVTAEMHDDTTILRSVEDDEGDLVLFDALHLWVGGSVQLDVHSMEDLFRHDHGGDSDADVRVRRAEVIVRAGLLDLGEVKVQYDIDSTVFRDFYWRWVSESASQTITLGNQKETLGLDYLMGNKFGTAMERSAPASAFGSYRSKGLRYNRWFNLSPEERVFDVLAEKSSYVTATAGVYTQDIENSHESDWAVTGRVTGGIQRSKNSGLHLGFSASYREGDFESISPRPELHEASRIKLAAFDADQQAVVGFETMVSRKSLHAQMELYYSDYRGGAVDAEGVGGYAQVGWLFGGFERGYRPRWGLWGPVNTRGQHVFEAFGRLSYTRGEADDSPWNDLRILTLGGNWYYKQLRGSVNLLLSETRREVAGEDAGHAITARIQYLF